MRVKTVSVEYCRTINLGNYSSAKLGVTLHADLESGDTPEQSIVTLQEQARTAVRDEYQRLVTRAATAAETNGNGSQS